MTTPLIELTLQCDLILGNAFLSVTQAVLGMHSKETPGAQKGKPEISCQQACIGHEGGTCTPFDERYASLQSD